MWQYRAETYLSIKLPIYSKNPFVVFLLDSPKRESEKTVGLVHSKFVSHVSLNKCDVTPTAKRLVWTKKRKPSSDEWQTYYEWRNEWAWDWFTCFSQQTHHPSNMMPFSISRLTTRALTRIQPLLERSTIKTTESTLNFTKRTYSRSCKCFSEFWVLCSFTTPCSFYSFSLMTLSSVSLISFHK